MSQTPKDEKEGFPLSKEEIDAIVEGSGLASSSGYLIARRLNDLKKQLLIDFFEEKFTFQEGNVFITSKLEKIEEFMRDMKVFQSSENVGLIVLHDPTSPRIPVGLYAGHNLPQLVQEILSVPRAKIYREEPKKEKPTGHAYRRMKSAHGRLHGKPEATNEDLASSDFPLIRNLASINKDLELRNAKLVELLGTIGRGASKP